jgi:hypothetical protein
MPRGGSKPGERRGGRQKGTPNKFTASRAVVLPPTFAASKPLYLRAKDELAELVSVVKGHVGQFQLAAVGADGSGLPGQPGHDPVKWDTFLKWMAFYRSVCDSAADFQDPRFKAIAIMAPPPSPPQTGDQRDNVVQITDPVGASRVYLNIVKGKAA